MPKIKKLLKDKLKSHKKIAILAIGSDLRGDDIAGIITGEYILSLQGKRPSKKISVIFGCTAPENVTGEIKKAKPSHLIVIDAADMREKPGHIGIIDPEDMAGASFSTHMLPPKILLQYLNLFFKCEIIVVGIQPRSLTFGKECSSVVNKSAKKLAEIILENV